MRYIAIIGLLLSTACATGYHPYDVFRGGYTQEYTGGGIYLVKFKGNNYTSYNEVVSSVYTRANELAARKHRRIIQSHLETYIEKHIGYRNVDSDSCAMMSKLGMREDEVTQDNCHMKSYEFDWTVAVLTIVLE